MSGVDYVGRCRSPCTVVVGARPAEQGAGACVYHRQQVRPGGAETGDRRNGRKGWSLGVFVIVYYASLCYTIG